MYTYVLLFLLIKYEDNIRTATIEILSLSVIRSIVLSMPYFAAAHSSSCELYGKGIAVSEFGMSTFEK